MSTSQGAVVLALILNQVLFGVNFPVSKVIVGKMDPFLWSNLRFLLAGVGMLFIALSFRRKHPVVDKTFVKQVIPLSFLGMALGQGLFLFGLKMTTAVNSAILITTIPILTLLIVIIRKQEDLSFNKIIGFGLAFLGVILTQDITSFQVGNETIIGDLLVFLGSLCFALYLSYGKNFLSKYDNMWSTTWMFFISGLAMCLFNIPKFSQLATIDYDTEFIICTVFSIIFATLLTYLLNNWALKKAPSGMVAVFIYLQPVVAGVVSYFYLGEQITIRMVICSIFILTGLIFTLKKKSKVMPPLPTID